MDLKMDMEWNVNKMLADLDNNDEGDTANVNARKSQSKQNHTQQHLWGPKGTQEDEGVIEVKTEVKHPTADKIVKINSVDYAI